MGMQQLVFNAKDQKSSQYQPQGKICRW